MDNQKLFNKLHVIEQELMRARNHLEGVEFLFEEIKRELLGKNERGDKDNG